MIEYVPGLPPEEVNYSTSSPLRQLFQLLLGLALVIALLYWLAGLAVILVVDRFPETLESALTQMADATLPDAALGGDPEQTARLNTLLNRLVPHLPADGPATSSAFRVAILEEESVNALAMPGNRIVVFSGLLDQIREDDQILFVLAHELGHFHHRDHLRRFGRGIVAVFLSALLTGRDSSLTTAAGAFLGGVESGYSRSQELDADRFALDLMDRSGVTRSGAEDFMRHVMETDSMHRLFYYFASHPSPEERLAAIREPGRRE